MYTLVTRADCLYCNQAKALLSEKNLAFDEMQIGKDITREEVLERYPGQKVVPIVIKDGVVLGSWSELLDDIYPPLETRDDG